MALDCICQNVVIYSNHWGHFWSILYSTNRVMPENNWSWTKLIPRAPCFNVMLWQWLPTHKLLNQSYMCCCPIDSLINADPICAPNSLTPSSVLEIPTGPPVQGRQHWRRTRNFLLIFLKFLYLWFEIQGMGTYKHCPSLMLMLYMLLSHWLLD